MHPTTGLHCINNIADGTGAPKSGTYQIQSIMCMIINSIRLFNTLEMNQQCRSIALRRSERAHHTLQYTCNKMIPNGDPQQPKRDNCTHPKSEQNGRGFIVQYGGEIVA